MKGKLKEKMEQARLEELMPGFDREESWNNIAAQLGGRNKKNSLSWKIAAGMALLLATGIAATLFLKSGTPETFAGNQTQPANWGSEMGASIPEMHHTTMSSGMPADLGTAGRTGNTRIYGPANNTGRTGSDYNHTKEFVCNSTPCPLEICIIQTIRCKDKPPAAVATCNTLEPDQARQLHYKAPEAGGTLCNVTVDEIRIRRVTTGETIVLNANSRPSTAQELFDCITGAEKCNMLAGIFESDCDNEQRSHSLKIDNSMGSLIME